MILQRNPDPGFTLLTAVFGFSVVMFTCGVINAASLLSALFLVGSGKRLNLLLFFCCWSLINQKRPSARAVARLVYADTHMQTHPCAAGAEAAPEKITGFLLLCKCIKTLE